MSCWNVALKGHARSTHLEPDTPLVTYTTILQRYKFLVHAFICRCCSYCSAASIANCQCSLLIRLPPPRRHFHAAAETLHLLRHVQLQLSPPPLCSPRYLNTIPNSLCSPLPRRPRLSRPRPSVIDRSRTPPNQGALHLNLFHLERSLRHLTLNDSITLYCSFQAFAHSLRSLATPTRSQ